MKDISCWCVILGIILILIIHLFLKEYGILENFDTSIEDTFMASFTKTIKLGENDTQEETPEPTPASSSTAESISSSTPEPASSTPEPIDCVGSWGDWSNCSETCGGGKKTRDYSITTPAENGGEECSAEDGDIIIQDCNTQACPNISGVLRNGTHINPLNMSGQGRTSSSWEECRDRCINTPGCEYFNRFPNGGCHITDGSQGPSPGGNNPTSHSGRARAFTPNNNPGTDGRWYMPLNMPGQGRTSTTWTGCRDRCIHTKGCKYFNRFPNGGCHITDGSEGTRTVPGNPTSHSGQALLE